MLFAPQAVHDADERVEPGLAATGRLVGRPRESAVVSSDRRERGAQQHVDHLDAEPEVQLPLFEQPEDEMLPVGGAWQASSLRWRTSSATRPGVAPYYRSYLPALCGSCRPPLVRWHEPKATRRPVAGLPFFSHFRLVSELNPPHMSCSASLAVMSRLDFVTELRVLMNFGKTLFGRFDSAVSGATFSR